MPADDAGTNLADMATLAVRQLVLGDLRLRQASLNALCHGTTRDAALHVARDMRASIRASMVRTTTRRLLFRHRRDVFQAGDVTANVVLDPEAWPDDADAAPAAKPRPTLFRPPSVLSPPDEDGFLPLRASDGRVLSVRLDDDELKGAFGFRPALPVRDWPGEWAVVGLRALGAWARDGRPGDARPLVPRREDDPTPAGMDQLLSDLQRGQAACRRFIRPDSDDTEIAALDAALRRWHADLGSGYTLRELSADVVASLEADGDFAQKDDDAVMRIAFTLTGTGEASAILPRPADTFVRGDTPFDDLNAIVASHRTGLAEVLAQQTRRPSADWLVALDRTADDAVWLQTTADGAVGSTLTDAQFYTALLSWTDAAGEPCWLLLELQIDLTQGTVAETSAVAWRTPAATRDALRGRAWDRLSRHLALCLAALTHWSRLVPLKLAD